MRTRIIQAATQLFAKRGFTGTSIDAIAEAVGIRKPSLLYHFPSKAKLREVVLDDLMSHWNEGLPRILAAATDGVGHVDSATAGVQQFEAVTREGIAFFSRDPDRARLLVREMLDRPDDMKRRLAAHVRPWLVLISDYIRRGRAQGHVHADVDPEAYVAQMITMVVGGMSAYSTLGLELPGSADGVAPETRYLRELLRVARASLFVRTSRPVLAG